MSIFALFMFLMFAVILAIVIIVIVFAVKKGNKYFDENKKYGVAIIVGYATDSSTVFRVRIPDLGDNRSHNLEGVYNVKKLNGKLDTRYPHFKIGDEVEVEYAPKKMAGIKVVDVRLRRELYEYSK